MVGSLEVSIDQLNWGKVADIRYINAALSEVQPRAFEVHTDVVVTLTLSDALLE